METLQELRIYLKRLEAKWDSGNIGDPSEILRLDREIKTLKKKIRAMEG